MFCPIGLALPYWTCSLQRNLRLGDEHFLGSLPGFSAESQSKVSQSMIHSAVIAVSLSTLKRRTTSS